MVILSNHVNMSYELFSILVFVLCFSDSGVVVLLLFYPLGGREFVPHSVVLEGNSQWCLGDMQCQIKPEWASNIQSMHSITPLSCPVSNYFSLISLYKQCYLFFKSLPWLMAQSSAIQDGGAPTAMSMVESRRCYV